MSKSDTCIEAARELLRYQAEDGVDESELLNHAIESMVAYVVIAEAVLVLNSLTPDDKKPDWRRAMDVFLQHLKDTPDWTGSVQSRLDDFNVIHAALRDPNYKPEYITIATRQ